MPFDSPLPKDRIASSFRQLTTVSTDLNAAASELGVSIVSLENALQSLNLGVPAWHQIAGKEDDDGSYWSRGIGYTQVGNNWRIALKVTHGNEHADHHREEVWAFNDAPRWMCIESVDKLPDLFDDLIKRTEETTAKIRAKTTQTEELAAAVRAIRGETKSIPRAKK
jgi:hypothetical protein